MKQRGNLQLYAIVGILLVTIGGLAYWQFQHAITENVRLKADLATLQTAHQEQLAENEMMRQANARAQQLLAERQAARNTADNIERAVNAKLADVYRQSTQARAWRDQPVPADVLRGLRTEPAGTLDKDRKGTPAGKPANADAGR